MDSGFRALTTEVDETSPRSFGRRSQQEVVPNIDPELNSQGLFQER